MILYPAIDLYQAQAVRLEKGRFDRMTVYDKDPVARALHMRDEGATHLHLVDLEGARFGSTANLLGVSRVILGTAAVENEELLEEALEHYGKAVAVGVDLLDGAVAVRGWEEKSRWTAEAFFGHLTDLGVQTVICTDISRDGMLGGSNHALYEELNTSFSIDLIASGGVSSLEDLRALRDLGMAGAILGKAYYSGAVSLPDALKEAEAC